MQKFPTNFFYTNKCLTNKETCYILQAAQGARYKRGVIMGCEGCSQGCLNENTKEGALLKKIEGLIKKGNTTNNKMYYPGLEITITGLLSVNPEFCPTYVITIIRRILKAKTGKKPDQLIDVFKKVIVKEFNAMDDNASTLGWSGAQEILKDLKENVPELEEPLRKYLHKMIGCE